MFKSLNWWISFRRNVNFWDWVRDTYSDEDLRQLADESTDCSLINSYNPMGDSTWDQFTFEEDVRRKTVQKLIKRYGNEIWSCCLGAASPDPGNVRAGLSYLST